MTVLSAIQSAAPALGIAIPESVYSSNVRTNVELGAIANEIGDRIATHHDWERLKRLFTLTGDGSDVDFAWPTDYSRMAKGQRIYTTQWQGPLRHVVDHDEWLQLQVQTVTSTTPAWTMLGGKFNFYPALGAGVKAKGYYLSNLWARSAGTETGTNTGFPYTFPFTLADSAEFGERQTEFMQDTDFFQLDERLLKLGIIWQWRAYKGLPYAEDFANYEDLLAKLIARDKGPRGIVIGRRRTVDYSDAVYSYPGTLG